MDFFVPIVIGVKKFHQVTSAFSFLDAIRVGVFHWLGAVTMTTIAPMARTSQPAALAQRPPVIQPTLSATIPSAFPAVGAATTRTIAVMEVTS